MTSNLTEKQAAAVLDRQRAYLEGRKALDGQLQEHDAVPGRARVVAYSMGRIATGVRVRDISPVGRVQRWWLLTHWSVVAVDCPTCGRAAGLPCRGARKDVVSTVHTARRWLAGSEPWVAPTVSVRELCWCRMESVKQDPDAQYRNRMIIRRGEKNTSCWRCRGEDHPRSWLRA